ncbi:MAG: glycosyltransferase family 2 protein [Acidobacteria bacterium]|nr:glycosyltransferase family 2 protein [Acidobacteriota bacterium]
MADPSTTTVIIPAFNEQDAIADVVAGVRAIAPWHEVLVIDDGSADETADRARTAGARVVSQPYNKGLGAAIKQGLRAARGEHLVILDGDGQHRPEDALRLVARLGDFDLAVGARSPSTQATIGRRLGNALLNRLATDLAQQPVKDLTSGLRAARTAQLRQFLYMLPNGFSAATTITLAYIRAGYSVVFEPIETRARTGRSNIRFARDGFKFWLILLRVVTIYSPLRVFVPISLLLLAGGVGYAFWTIATQLNVTNTSVVLTVTGILVFLIGLVSDQIATLRFGLGEHDND